MSRKQLKHTLRHIVAVSNNKGGTGKTSTVLNLASAISRRIEGYRVLVIDCDPQRDLSYFLGWNDKDEQSGNPTLYTALTNPSQGLPVYRAENGLYFTPSSFNMNNIDATLQARINPNTALYEILSRPIDDRTKGQTDSTTLPLPASITDSFDFVFIDTQPAMSRITINAFYAADGYIITTELEEASTKGMISISTAAGTVGRDKINTTNIVSGISGFNIHGILFTKLNEKLSTAKLYGPQVRSKFIETFKTAIHDCTDVSKSQALREDVFTSYAGCKAAQDYIALADEYLRKFA